jgi:hypothetical protein
MSLLVLQHLSLRQVMLLMVGVFFLSASAAAASTNLSVWVFPGASGRLIAQPDAVGNRILDESGVGYKSGLAPLPASNTVPVKITVLPAAGDNVSNIQSAINYVSAQPVDTNGFRGAVLLSNGVYQCASTIYLKASGVVLRGMSSATNGSGAVLEATATNQYTLIEITGSGSASSGTTHTITNLYVPVGARSFFVDSTSGLSVGAEVYVRRVATTNWIHDLGMDLLGPPPDVPWTTSGYMLDMDRVITHIEGNHIFVDAPITCAIDARYANGTIRPFTWTGLITNVGIEHIFGKSDYFGSTTNETHAWTFIQFDKVVNGWAHDVNSQYFGYSCVNLNSGDKFITVQDCQSLDPVSIITGGRRYAFAVNDAQYCLVKNCYTRQDRHQFVTQSLTIGPDVFVDGTSDSAHAEAGPHQRWATGILWDNIAVHGGNNDIQNGGNYGTGHGWEGANCVIWNNAANGFIVQNPPGANNWLIGSIGPIQTGTAWNIGYTNMPHAAANYDSSGSSATNVFPDSLYFSQLQDRLAAPNLQTRDYWLGDIDQFTNNLPGGEKVFLDSTWSNAVKSAASGQPLDGFDVVTNNHWIPFTFNFSRATNERVVAATLALALRATNSASSDVLYLDGTNNSFTFSSLGWLPIGTGTNTTVRVLDLGNQLNLLTNGQLNVAAQGDLGIDWAMLELQVAPNISATITTLTPVADATVRGGTSAANNFGAAMNLTVRQDASANNQQRAYLRWDMSGVSGKISQARVILTPLTVGANGIEQGVAVANSNNWMESGVTWNTQPGGGERFATWLPSTNGSVSFDVTSQVLDALQNDKQLSLQLFSIGTNSVDYASRENASVTSRPQLVLSRLGSPPTISDITDRTIAPNTTTGPISFMVGGTLVSNLTVSGDSSNPNLVPGSNLVVGGSGANRTVTVTPLANQSGIAVITVTVTDSSGLTASDGFTLTVSSHAAAKIIWNGPGAGANNWSTTNHWLPTEAPEFLDDVKFFDAGAGGVAVSNVNNFVDANCGGNIASLQFGNTNGNHTTLISSGDSLDLSGTNGFIVGTETDNGSAQTVFATVTGIGGAININNDNADLIVRQGSANNSSQRATLDLSGLGNFSASVNQVLVGVAGPVNRPVGTLYLARTNSIVASGTPGICAADSGSNGGSASYLYLGIENEIDADTITIGRQKSSATLSFNPAFTNSSPEIILRGAGPDRVATLAIGDNSGQSVSSSPSSGVVDFSGGTVDALVDVIFVGKGQTGSGSGTATGTLTLNDGTLDVNTLEAGYQNSSSAAAVVTGTVNVKGAAQLLVNSTLRLARYTGSGMLPVGTLNIIGGTVAGDGDIIAGGGASTIAISNGVLGVTGVVGTPAAPIGKVALTNATLQFSADTVTINLVTSSLTTGGNSNAISLAALPDAPVPAQIPLIDYTSAIGGAGFNFVLGSVVPGGGFSGYLSNNVANRSVDLVFVSLPATPPGFAAVKLSGTNLIFSGTNGAASWPYFVLASTNLALPLNQWPRVATNSFDGAGNFNFTNSLNLNAPQKFCRLQLF